MRGHAGLPRRKTGNNMKISEIFHKNRLTFSFEFFPPKTDEGMIQLFEAVRDLKSLDPGYVSVTYGAGGGTKAKTLDITRRIKNEIGIESMAHLTCVGHSKDELKGILDEIKGSGIENIIALRGDPPKGETSFVPHPDGFSHASELVRFIKSHNDFCVGVAGYPEKHPEAPDMETDLNFLKEKVAAGADFVVSQLYFDNADFFAFEKKLRDKGVTAPVIPGIMPITNFSQLVRFTNSCGARIPPKIIKDLEPIQDDSRAVQQYGINYAVDQCFGLIAHGVKGIHFFTLNRSVSSKTIVETLKKHPVL